MSKLIVTGAAGFLGAWITRHAIEEDHEVLGVDLSTDYPLASLVNSGTEFDKAILDVRDREAFEGLVDQYEPDAMIHLVSMLMPGCKAHPENCVDVNVKSFMAVLELARNHSFNVAYASSAWVLNAPPGTEVANEREWIDPQSLYGVFKLANEGMSRTYAREYGVKSNGLRPYIVYGPGRERGLTADIDLALVAAAKGERFEIGFGGTVAVHHVSDVARTFVRLATQPVGGGEVYNLRGSVVHMSEVVEAIETVTATKGLVTFKHDPLPIAADLDDKSLQQTYGPLEFMSLEEGLRQTLDVYRTAQRIVK